MLKKLTALLAAGLFFLSMGCAAIKAPCQYEDEFYAYKGQVAAALASVQVGYPMALAILDKVKENAIDEDKFKAEADFYLAKVWIVDQALSLMGSLYFDNVCLDENDVAMAEAAAELALQAQAEMGVVIE